MRRRGKRDTNHADVVGWYRKLGASVLDLGDMGAGVPDLLVAMEGQMDLVEVKYEKGTLTEDQQEFIQNWKQSKVVIVRTHADVIIHVGQMRIRAK
jgi:Holliday junction resolvase-like predicted endonuclease